MKDTCCRDCESRRPGCHGSCEKYRAWAARIREEKEARRKDKHVDSFHAECVAKARKRNKKQYGMKKGEAR